jgi:hypothetical protein
LPFDEGINEKSQAAERNNEQKTDEHSIACVFAVIPKKLFIS